MRLKPFINSEWSILIESILLFSIDFPIFMILITFISLLGTAIFYQNNTTIVNGMIIVFGLHLFIDLFFPSYRQSDTVAGFHHPFAMV